MTAPGVLLSHVDLRPQSVLLTFFGDYVSGEHEVVATASLIGVLEAAGVGNHATRATVARMVRRHLLRRVAVGRQAYFGLTDFGRRTVADGRARALTADVVEEQWDGRWTFVAFSLPEQAQRERHGLRSRLTWAGFGMVQAGLWAAPRAVDVVELLSDLDVLAHVTATSGELIEPTKGSALVASCYDLDAIGARYQRFVGRWQAYLDSGPDGVEDALVTRVVLGADWLSVLRHDPRLPREFVPVDWPGLQALDLHRALESRLRRPAEREAGRRLDVRVVGG